MTSELKQQLEQRWNPTARKLFLLESSSVILGLIVGAGLFLGLDNGMSGSNCLFIGAGISFFLDLIVVWRFNPGKQIADTKLVNTVKSMHFESLEARNTIKEALDSGGELRLRAVARALQFENRSR